MSIQVGVLANNVMTTLDDGSYHLSRQFEEWSETAYGRIYHPLLSIGYDGLMALFEFEDIRDAIIFKMRWA